MKSQWVLPSALWQVVGVMIAVVVPVAVPDGSAAAAEANADASSTTLATAIQALRCLVRTFPTAAGQKPFRSLGISETSFSPRKWQPRNGLPQSLALARRTLTGLRRK